jgi:hypothetical protein
MQSLSTLCVLVENSFPDSILIVKRQIVEWILPLPDSRTRTATGLLRLATSKEGRVAPGAILLQGQVDNLCRQLLTYDPSQCWPVSKFSLSILPEAKPTINCFQALDYLCAHSLSALIRCAY